jgi:hypothetical protein
MPYKSDAQRRFFHTETARRKGISAATVQEYDAASRGRSLPKRAKKPLAKRTSPAHRAQMRGGR